MHITLTLLITIICRQLLNTKHIYEFKKILLIPRNINEYSNNGFMWSDIMYFHDCAETNTKYNKWMLNSNYNRCN